MLTLSRTSPENTTQLNVVHDGDTSRLTKISSVLNNLHLTVSQVSIHLILIFFLEICSSCVVDEFLGKRISMDRHTV